MDFYGNNIRLQNRGPISDTKILIKLHSAAITIQQEFRKWMLKTGFYDHEINESPMYIDSEHDNFHYQYDMLSSEKKPFGGKI